MKTGSQRGVSGVAELCTPAYNVFVPHCLGVQMNCHCLLKLAELFLCRSYKCNISDLELAQHSYGNRRSLKRQKLCVSSPEKRSVGNTRQQILES